MSPSEFILIQGCLWDITIIYCDAFIYCTFQNLTSMAYCSQLQSMSPQALSDYELHLAQLYAPTFGIYVVPQPQKRSNWNGIIFVRHGPYKDAVFCFTITLSLPQIPTIAFSTAPFHALIHASTGELDVSTLLDRPWHYGEDTMLYNILRAMRGMWSNDNVLSCLQSLNPTAGRLYQRNRQEFIGRVMTSVGKGRQNLSLSRSSWLIGGQGWQWQQQGVQWVQKQMKDALGNGGTVQEKRNALIARLFAE